MSFQTSPRRLISYAAVATEENFLTASRSICNLPLEDSGTMINTLNDPLRGVDLTTLRRLLSVMFKPPSRHPATSSKAPVMLTPAFRDASALHSMTLIMVISLFPGARRLAPLSWFLLAPSCRSISRRQPSPARGASRGRVSSDTATVLLPVRVQFRLGRRRRQRRLGLPSGGQRVPSVPWPRFHRSVRR